MTLMTDDCCTTGQTGRRGTYDLAVIGAGASPIDLVANGLSVPSGSGLAGADNGIDCCDAVANGFGPSGLGAWNGLSGGFCCAEPPAHAGT